MEKGLSSERRDPQSASEEIKDWNDCSSSHDQHGSRGKYLKSTWTSANVKLHRILFRHTFLIFSNNNCKNDSEKEKEQPQTVTEEIEAEQYSETLEDKEDSECTPWDIQVVSDSLVYTIDRQPHVLEVKIKKDVNNCKNLMISSPEAEPKANSIVNHGRKSTSCHPEGTSVRDVINSSRESSSIQLSGLFNMSQEPDEDKGRGSSFLTITSQIHFKLNYKFTLLICSLLLTTSSAVQPVWDGVCHRSDLEKSKHFLFNNTELEYLEHLHAYADKDERWSFLEMEGILENMSYAYFMLVAFIVFLLWKMWHGLGTAPTDVPVLPLNPTNQPAWDDTDESDDDSFQSYFNPPFPVPVTTTHVFELPLPDTNEKSASSQKYKPKRRNFSQDFPTQIETGVTKNTYKSPETDGEIAFGLPLEASEFVSTETLDGSPFPEETAAYDQSPPPAGIQESMDGHYSSSAIVSGKMTKVRDFSELNATPAVNVICALHPSLQPEV